MTRDALDSLEEKLGHRFSDRQKLKEALTPPGAGQTLGGRAYNYQRLEFLGDAVLGLAVAEILYEMYPAENEGALAKRQASLIRRDTLVRVAQELGLDQYIHYEGADAQLRANASALEDVTEALLGALYLDGGHAVVKDFVAKHWKPLARESRQPPRDNKTSLQEWVQAHGRPLPRYELVETTGPAHAPEFRVSVKVQTVSGEELAVSSSAGSKRQAEQQAAGQLLSRLERSAGPAR